MRVGGWLEFSRPGCSAAGRYSPMYSMSASPFILLAFLNCWNALKDFRCAGMLHGGGPGGLLRGMGTVGEVGVSSFSFFDFSSPCALTL